MLVGEVVLVGVSESLLRRAPKAAKEPAESCSSVEVHAVKAQRSRAGVMFWRNLRIGGMMVARRGKVHSDCLSISLELAH